MTSSPSSGRRDARDCPRCGVMGILPLHQEPGDGAVTGTIENPVMICPVCETEYRATGVTWMGAVSVADLSDDQCHDVARQTLARAKEVHNRSTSDSSRHEPSKSVSSRSPGPDPIFIDIGDMTDEEIDELAVKLNEHMAEVASQYTSRTAVHDVSQE